MTIDCPFLCTSEKISSTSLEDADINIVLRGPDERDNKGQRYERWVKYTDFRINEKSILFEPVEVWHDKPYRYTLHAIKDYAYVIKLKWRKK